MKIGIITFHWATNYGAILQAYALQTYLKKLGHDVYIINYRPKQYKKTFLSCFSTIRFWLYLTKLKEYFLEKKMEFFRKEYLNETILYESMDDLKSNSPKFDIYVSGSDQIWNPYFTAKGEGKPTSVYFLDFGDNKITRIAYAVSFGCENYPEDVLLIAKKYIFNYKAISVREDSAIPIVKKMGYKTPIKLPDPTLLLFPDEYSIFWTNEICPIKKAFIYILREKDIVVKKIESYLKIKFAIKTTNNTFNQYSVGEWLSSIKNASIVLTNSFHGMVFSLIFHVPFIILLAKGHLSGMNDRFFTMLSYLDLESRIVLEVDYERLNSLISDQINWQKVDSRLSVLKIKSDEFFYQILKEQIKDES